MTKMWSDVRRLRPRHGVQRHTGPAAQMWSLDDFICGRFRLGRARLRRRRYAQHREPAPADPDQPRGLPPDVRSLGRRTTRRHPARLAAYCARSACSPTRCPYQANYLDLDPRYRDRSGLGLPLLRITYEMQANEHRLADYMESKAEEILRAMGATKTWRGPRFSGVGQQPRTGRVPHGRRPRRLGGRPRAGVHDTPGLYVFGTAVFPTCHGVNPTLTMWALCYRAAEQLAARLRRGQEP